MQRRCLWVNEQNEFYCAYHDREWGTPIYDDGPMYELFLLELFQAYGNVSSAKVVMDRVTDRSKGFGFVEMPSDDEGTNAINKLNGHEINGRALRVNEARPREDRRPGGGGGGVVVAAGVDAVGLVGDNGAGGKYWEGMGTIGEGPIIFWPSVGNIGAVGAGEGAAGEAHQPIAGWSVRPYRL